MSQKFAVPDQDGVGRPQFVAVVLADKSCQFLGTQRRA